MLVERFASNKSLDGLLHEISDMNNNIQTDYILRDYVEEYVSEQLFTSPDDFRF